MMKKQKINFKFKEKKISLEVGICRGLGMVRGLMFRSRERAPVLLFDFSKSCLLEIHSWFVFFPFVAVWLGSDGKVVEMKVVRPWKISVKPSRKFKTLVEIPLNNKYSKVTKILVGK